MPTGTIQELELKAREQAIASRAQAAVPPTTGGAPPAAGRALKMPDKMSYEGVRDLQKLQASCGQEVDRLDAIMTACEEELKKRGASLDG